MIPECEDLPYMVMEEGDVFGIIDLVPEDREIIIEKEVERTFSVLALDNSEVLCLSIEVCNGLLKCVGPVGDVEELPLCYCTAILASDLSTSTCY